MMSHPSINLEYEVTFYDMTNAKEIAAYSLGNIAKAKNLESPVPLNMTWNENNEMSVSGFLVRDVKLGVSLRNLEKEEIKIFDGHIITMLGLDPNTVLIATEDYFVTGGVLIFSVSNYGNKNNQEIELYEQLFLK